MNYSVFTDESYTTGERYRSIAAFSFPTKFREDIFQSVAKILEDSGVTEFKWQKLRTAKYKFCAEKIILYCIDLIWKKDARVDILTWDIQDRRHNVRQRDDISNFGRMFFHLFKSVICYRERGSVWQIFPDERPEIDWETINDCLNSIGRRQEPTPISLFGDAFIKENIEIECFEQAKSHLVPCCQIADLFAGLSVFSINNYSKYRQWKEGQNFTLNLFGESTELKLSNSKKYRIFILDFL